MRQRLVLASALSVGILGATILSAGAAEAKGGSRQWDSPAPATVPAGALTDAQLAAMAPKDQTARFAPLRAIANAVDAIGKSSEAGVYSNIGLDGNHEAVDLYLTNLSKASELLSAAHDRDPSIDTSLVRLHTAPYTLVQLHAARERLLQQSAAHALPYQVLTTAVARDGSSLQVGVSDVATAVATRSRPQAKLNGASVDDLAAGVKIVFGQGHVGTSRAWRDVKWHDSHPFIAGDTLISDDTGQYCAAGLPAVRKSDGHKFMVSAAHCFPAGDRAYTGGGTTGAYDGSEGNYVGDAYSPVDKWDSVLLDGTDNNSDESDQTGWIPVTSYAYSYNGDMVYQDGPRSFFLGHGTVSGIKVNNQDATNTITTLWGHTYTERGVEGVVVGGGWGSADGDSGAMVFTINTNDSSTRQARGIVSSCKGYPCNDGDPDVFWTEATDIFNQYGLKLNPVT